MDFGIVHRVFLLFAVALCGSIFVSAIAAQPSDSKPLLRLLDEFGPSLSWEERGARLDMLFSELGIYKEPRKDTSSTGYVFLYCGKVCRYGEVEAHIRGIELKMHAREVPRERIKIVVAGYREQFKVELWIAADSQTAPVPRSTVNIKDIRFTKTTNRIVESYDCCDDPNEVWELYRKSKPINF